VVKIFLSHLSILKTVLCNELLKRHQWICCTVQHNLPGSQLATETYNTMPGLNATIKG